MLVVACAIFLDLDLCWHMLKLAYIKITLCWEWGQKVTDEQKPLPAYIPHTVITFAFSHARSKYNSDQKNQGVH